MVSILNKKRAEKLHKQAMGLSSSRPDEALSLYFKVLDLDEARSNTHYNIGLIYKYRGDWSPSLMHNKRAYTLDQDNQAAIWNWGIAATALSKWDDARAAWREYGIEIEGEEGPVVCNFGSAPVRIFSKDGSAEVVWGKRIDPARIEIENIPFPKSGYRYRDIVLNDGAPNGTRVSGGREYDVFDSLGVWKSSEFKTFLLKVEALNVSVVGEFLEFLFENDMGAEDWTGSCENICQECSEGSVNQDARNHQSEWQYERDIGVATPDEMFLKNILKTWKNSDLKVLHIEEQEISVLS